MINSGSGGLTLNPMSADVRPCLGQGGLGLGLSVGVGVGSGVGVGVGLGFGLGFGRTPP